MLSLTIKLLIAHILGDFVLQPDSWVASKKEKRHKSKFLYFHGLVLLGSLLVILQFDLSYWPYILLIVISHLFIDLIKLDLEGKIKPTLLFVSDQIIHLIVIALVVYLKTPFKIDFDELYSPKYLLFILALLSVTFVASIVMKVIMSRWVLEEDKPEDSLKNAGKYIGVLERLFVFGFILLNQWSAIGLLITAKSVFRFSDLTRAKDRKLTEYILIGTLISFGFAIVIGLLYNYFVEVL